jgi:hypothetical protein
MIKRKEILISFLFIILLVLPLIAFSQDEEACRHLEVPIPGLTSTCLPALPDYIVAIYNFALMIIGIICFGALLYGGLRYLTSVGKPAAISDARDQIFSALLGLIILFSAYLILRTINPELVILYQEPPQTFGCTKKEDCPAKTDCESNIKCKYCKGVICQYFLHACNTNNDCPDLECVEGICSATTSESWASGCFYSHQNECEDPKVNCDWCPKCSGDKKVNDWGFDKCVDQGTDCGYECVVGECDATSCE